MKCRTVSTISLEVLKIVVEFRYDRHRFTLIFFIAFPQNVGFDSGGSLQWSCPVQKAGGDQIIFRDCI